MRLAWILFCLAGCANMAPSGDPTAPVVVEKPQAEAPTPSPTPATDTKVEEPFTISSEQLQANAAEAKAEGLPPAGAAPASDVTPSEPAADPLASAAPPPEAPPTPVAAPAPISPPLPAAAWPARLVKTVPDAQPPRAILGLPDGKEIVITPGQLLPDLGLVVLGIGPTNAQFAQITPTGDHAQIAPLTLFAQY